MKKTTKVSRRPRPGPAAQRTAQVSELKAGLSAYLARVKAGEEVVVTDRGTPVARLVPVGHPVGHHAEWASVRALEVQGRVVVRGEGRVPKRFWELALPELPTGSAVRALLEDREEAP
jgi:prevent-host-death family protein